MARYGIESVKTLRYSTPLRWQYTKPMIREATEADIPRIQEMGSRSLREGPYKDMVGDNPEQTGKLAIEVMQKGIILVSEENEALTGVLAFIVFPHYFSGELTAGEVIWHVEKEYRHSFTALALLRAAERMARGFGAKRMQFTAPSEEVGKAYESLHYSKVEVTYQKAL
jgi:N-acetylglutamate synthase-like GNAT family acetyltransferase